MTKRLHVRLDDSEHRTIRRLAKRDKVTLSEWVRRRLREGVAASSRLDSASRLAAINAAYRQTSSGPEADIDQMLAETERGYLSDSSLN